MFRLSADVLRAAGGQVRCGRCGEVFNALARLAEDATTFTQGESPLELETRADEILQSVDAVAPVETVTFDQAEIAHLQVLDALDDDVDLEASLEFTLPPGELDRIFVESPLGPLQQLAADDRDIEGGRDESREPAPVTAESPPASPAVAAFTPAPLAAGMPPPAPKPIASGAPPEEPAGATLPAPLPRPSRTLPAGTEASGLAIPEEVRAAMLSSFAHAQLPQINAPQRRVPFAAWLCAAVMLALLLAAQLARSNGDWLAAHSHLLGGPVSSAATLSAYQLRQWGVTGDPAAKGTLRVRASIMNAAARSQPYPLLRVSLANRFGARVGEREFEPAEYLGRAPARMLAPGERIDATLDLVDPGNDAEGFEIDVCLRGSDKKTVCADDSATQAR
ncbi:MAG: DUF3426 domain-containing protein [Pseudomonadota bacterium]|nr:DUF3426 domain-containing protein [Pseudomonadota bacterium]